MQLLKTHTANPAVELACLTQKRERWIARGIMENAHCEMKLCDNIADYIVLQADGEIIGIRCRKHTDEVRKAGCYARKIER